MSFKRNVLKARSRLVLMAAIFASFVAVVLIDKYSPSAAGMWIAAVQTNVAPSVDRPASPKPRALNASEQVWARTAWQYFVNNTQASTGLADAVEGHHVTTMWDIGSYLLAVIAAYQLEIISTTEFNMRMHVVLTTLAQMPLYAAQLPNKFYDTYSLQMVNDKYSPVAQGVGWSALDIGRLVTPLSIVAWRYPALMPDVQDVIQRWKVALLSLNGELMGASLINGKTIRHQEGRLGYEQYAARSLMLIGLDCSASAAYIPYLNYVDIYDIPIPIDIRNSADFGAQNAVLSEPYLLEGLEFGLQDETSEFAWRLLKVQRARYLETGKLTAVSEDHIDQKPYFVYNAIYADGKQWVAVTDKGQQVSSLRSLSTKAAFGWYALYPDDYTRRLVERVAALGDPQKGWYAGIYEASGLPNKALNANTNAVVLESLAYIARGPLLKF